MKYEHLYRHAGQIAALADLCHQAGHYRMIFNGTRPHEALGMRPLIEIIRCASPHRSTRIEFTILCQRLDHRQSSSQPLAGSQHDRQDGPKTP
ncbi:MAG TPA: hypothetical protein DHU96_17000 [Actinobacteria bacterium]|nr:hypothetical protein [Actinomycetota bacterium]